MRHVKNKELNKSAAAHFWSHKCKFEEEPKLLKHTNKKLLLELLIWEKYFIYKNKEVAINFDIPQFNDLLKLMDADNGREMASSSTPGVFNVLSSMANLHISYNPAGRSHCRLQIIRIY